MNNKMYKQNSSLSRTIFKTLDIAGFTKSSPIVFFSLILLLIKKFHNLEIDIEIA